MNEVMIGEICEITKGQKINETENNIINSEYSIICASRETNRFHNNYNTDENTILCYAVGNNVGFITKYNKKVWADENCIRIIPINNLINNNYLYYLLKTIQHKIYDLRTGTTMPRIKIDDIRNIKIFIHSHEQQIQIVDYCIQNETYIQQLETDIEDRQNTIHNYLLNEFSQSF